MTFVRSLICLLVAFSILAAGSDAREKSIESTARAPEANDFKRVQEELAGIFLEYFPRAKVERTNSSLKIQFKVKHVKARPGSQKLLLAPKLDGILCTARIEPGAYSGKHVLPFKVHELLYTSLLMAPYSEPSDCHLMTRLLYPPNTPESFIYQVKDIVSSFEKKSRKRRRKRRKVSITTERAGSAHDTTSEANQSGRTVNKSRKNNADDEETRLASAANPSDMLTTGRSEEATSSAHQKSSRSDFSPKAPSKSEPQETSDDSQEDEGEDEKTDFGPPRLSTYTFSDGRFQIKLPGSPRSKSTIRNGMKFVAYFYVETQGNYKLEYTNLNDFITGEEATKLLTSVCNSIASQSKGKVSSYKALNWQGYPGRELSIDKVGKAGKSIRARVILVRSYLYVMKLYGTRAWLDSPAVQEVLDSLKIRPVLTSEERSKLRRRYRGGSRSSARPYDQRKYPDKWQKRREKRDADRKFRRRRTR